MGILFLFLDGVGLGDPDPDFNPFARLMMPNLQNLLNGYHLVLGSHLPVHSERASLIALDACLGVSGLPQSATGQATLLTGRNIPLQLGYHYGPKPNQPIRDLLSNGNLFSQLVNLGYNCAFLNAYPPQYFQSVESGRRIYSAIPLAATKAGVQLKNFDHLIDGTALSADFTAQGWRENLKITDAPQITETEAGMRLGTISTHYDFALFEYWLSDYAGHKQDMLQATTLMTAFDQVLEGLLNVWEDVNGLIILTSDHGNLEDLRTRRHTINPVPALLIGDIELRQKFIHLMHSVKGAQENLNITCIAPAIIKFLTDFPERA